LRALVLLIAFCFMLKCWTGLGIVFLYLSRLYKEAAHHVLPHVIIVP
jgi:hypothetical protein